MNLMDLLDGNHLYLQKVAKAAKDQAESDLRIGRLSLESIAKAVPLLSTTPKIPVIFISFAFHFL